ncbi:MAG: hypothetical protein HYZ42_02665 [Bacteroidetes bacterium]|nr:hypothetical protein [Bacteroidota bacterium]
MKKNYIIVSCIVLLLLVIRFLPLKVPYNIYATGKVFANKEWVLGRTTDGRILSTMKDNVLDQISNYGGREFMRGDLFDFELEPGLKEKNYLKEGDIIGRLYSNELASQLTKLENDLKVEQAGYEVYATGEKPEIINEAISNKKLSQERFNNQRRLFERTEKLYKDSLISRQEYEIAKNNIDLLKLDIEIQEARLMKLQSGDKKQQLELIQARINSISNQIVMLKQRLEKFAVKAPFGGMLQHKKGAISDVEILTTLLDTSELIVITPIQFKEVQYLKLDDKVRLFLFHSDEEIEGKITNIDNVIQLVGGRQAVYITSKISSKDKLIIPGMFTQTQIHADDITLWDYSKRIFGNIFYR